MVPSIAPMYYLTELLVFTVALYTTFFCRQFSSRGHVSLTLTIALIVEVCGAVDGFDLFVLAFYDLRHVTCTTIAELYIVPVDDFS